MCNSLIELVKPLIARIMLGKILEMMIVTLVVPFVALLHIKECYSRKALPVNGGLRVKKTEFMSKLCG